MKKLLCLLLCVCLALPCALAENDSEASGVLAELPEKTYNLVGVAGDALYVCSWDTAYRAVDGGWEPVSLPLSDTMIFQSDGLYAVMRDMGEWDEAAREYIPPEDGVYTIQRAAVKDDGSFAEPETLCHIDWNFSDDEFVEINGLAVTDDAAYLLAYSWDSSNMYGQNQLWQVDLATGKGTLVTTDFLTGLLPYQDGLFLSKYFNRETAWHEDGTVDNPQIVAVDPASGAVTMLGSMVNSNCGCLVYNADSGAAYYSDTSYVYRFDLASGVSERVGRTTSMSYRENCEAAVWHDRYYLVDSQTQALDIATLDPALLPSRTLRVSEAYYLEDQNHLFLKEHPDVALEESENYVSSAQELTQHMTSDDAADIYFLRLSSGAFKTLRDKGWVTDLSSSQKLTDTIAAMDAHLVKPLTEDGKLYGVPVSVFAQMTGYYPKALETFGLTADELPQTYEDLLEFILTWRDDYADDFPDAIFFQMMRNLSETIFEQIFGMQVLLCEARDERMTFNTPTIQKLLKRLKSDEVQRAIEEVCPIVEGSMSWGSDEADHTLFTTSYDPMPSEYRFDDDSEPILMRLDSETEPVIPLEMTVMFVNPRSEHLETAIEYMEYMVDHLPQELKIALMPGVNDPIEYGNYQEVMQSYNDSIARVEAELEELQANGKEAEDAPDSPYYDMTVADLETYLDEFRSSQKNVNRWAYSAEDIAYYRENIEPYLVTVTDSVFTGEENQASTLMKQFMDGSMDAERFIREFDRIVDMMQMEQGL